VEVRGRHWGGWVYLLGESLVESGGKGETLGRVGVLVW